VDYGPLLTLVEQFFPNEADRRTLFWDTPHRLFGFGHASWTSWGRLCCRFPRPLAATLRAPVQEGITS